MSQPIYNSCLIDRSRARKRYVDFFTVPYVDCHHRAADGAREWMAAVVNAMGLASAKVSSTFNLNYCSDL